MTDFAADDGALVCDMVAGDANAWETFHRAYTPVLMRCIERAMQPFGCATDDDVREVHASLLLSLLADDRKKLRAFDAARGARLKSFLCLLAVHAAFDHLRAIKRSPWPAPFDEADEVASDELDPFEQTWRRLHAARVLAALGEKDRAFVALYLGEGLGFAEIADRMRVSTKTVYSKKHKLCSRLAAMKAC